MKIRILGLFTLAILLGIASIWYFQVNKKQQILYEILANQAIFIWGADQNPTWRIMEENTRKAIVADYGNAWKQQNVCLFLNDSSNLYAFFVPNARTVIAQNAQKLAKGHIKLIQKDTKHYLRLHFYSLDGQIISMTDSASITQNINDFQQHQYRTYEALLLLQEGHWRIKNLKLK